MDTAAHDGLHGSGPLAGARAQARRDALPPEKAHGDDRQRSWRGRPIGCRSGPPLC